MFIKNCKKPFLYSEQSEQAVIHNVWCLLRAASKTFCVGRILVLT